MNRYSRDKSAKARWPDAPDRGVLRLFNAHLDEYLKRERRQVKIPFW